MKNLQNFEQFKQNEQVGGNRAPIDKTGEQVVTIVTKESVNKFKLKNPGSPISMNEIGYHILKNNYREASDFKDEIELEGLYRGEEVRNVFITKKSRGIGKF